jgi:hypothetical protein
VSRLAVLIHRGGFVVAIAAYFYLSLSRVGTVPSHDPIIAWGYTDKRPLTYGYLLVAALVAFHWAMRGLFLEPRREPRPTSWRSPGIVGAISSALLAVWWLCLPSLASVEVADSTALAPFFEFNSHVHVHLGAFEQIRVGAIPYLEARTQYGLGNQVLTYWLTNAFGLSSHGFYAANMLINAIGIVIFFVIVQRVLGTGWSLVGIAGWIVWPSPNGIAEFGGWTILTRWLAVPVLSLLLAQRLLSAGPLSWRTPALAGAVWGLGGFLAQENLSGGLLVLGLSLALFGPPTGRRLPDLLRFVLLAVATALAVHVALVAASVGPAHVASYYLTRDAKSALVAVGVSNTWWSDEIERTIDLLPLVQTYGSALLLTVALLLVAFCINRRWSSYSDDERLFVMRFAGVTIGAYALHLFALLRSDYAHLAGPSLLLPLFIAMLPFFAWRFVRAPAARYALGGGVTLAIATALVVASGGLIDKATRGATPWRDAAAALNAYRDLLAGAVPDADIAGRYSPVPRVQAAFRSHRDFEDTQELLTTLRARLAGRRIELGLHTVNRLLAHPELFYFFGHFRSVSGMTAPGVSIWLRSEETAWIESVVNAPGACVFFESDTDSRLVEVWRKTAGAAVDQKIAGRKNYGILSCKP